MTHKRLLALAMFLLVSAVAAQADPLLVQGSASGAFYQGATNKGSTVEGLTFSGASFGPTTNTVLTLGTFTLGGSCLFCGSDNYNPFDFRLALNFSVPAGIGASTITADVSGKVDWIFVDHTVKVDFSNTPMLFNYTAGGGSGSFNLTISDVEFTSLGTKSLKGTISNATFAAAPEPTSIVLLGTLFAGAAVLVRKRLS